MAELKALPKLKIAGRLRYWRGTIEIPETELHAICDEIQAEHEQAIAATLGGGKLTAEQVRDAIERHFGKVAVLDDGKPVEWRDDWVCKVAIDYRGIADELNAALGIGTCCIVKTPSDSDFSDDWRYRCSECGCNIPVNERDPETGDVINAANYCPNCGKAVKR